jgi:GNAT superfamily N-acetyltransferase
LSATPIVVRDATPADAPELPALLAELGYPAADDAVARRIAHCDASAAARLLVADAGGRILGLAALAFLPLLHHDADLCRITAFVVSPAARRQGVGRRLVDRIEAIARERGCERVEVNSAEHREAAHRFYGALGYARKSVRFQKIL